MPIAPQASECLESETDRVPLSNPGASRAGGAAVPSAGFDRRLGRRRTRGAIAEVDLAASLKASPAFATLSDTEIATIVSRAQPRSYGLGEVILRQGDQGSGLYILRRGHVRIVDETDPSDPLALSRLSPGAVFGERSLLFDVPVGATVRATGPVDVLALPIPAFRALVAERPEIARTMTETIARYERSNSIRRTPAFGTLADSDVERLLDAVEIVSLRAGEPLIAEGQPDDGYWVVQKGELQVLAREVRQDGQEPQDTGAESEEPTERPVRVLRPTDAFGLQSLFDLETVSFRAIAIEESELFRWPSGLIRQLMASDPQLSDSLLMAAELEREQQETIFADHPHEENSDSARPGTGLSVRLERIGPWWWRTRLRVHYSEDSRLRGLACLASAASWFGRPLDIRGAAENQLKGHSDDTLISLARRAEEFGLVSRLLRLRASRITPAMVPFAFCGANGEMRLAVRAGGDAIDTMDSRTGRLETVTRQELAEWWTGEALTLNFVPDFGAIGERKSSIFDQVLPILKPHQTTLLRLVGLTLLTLSIGVALPLFMQLIIDHVLVFNDRSLLILLLISILMASVMSLIAGGARSLLMVRVANMVNGIMMTRLFAHVLAVPLGRLQKWRVGELSVRFHENKKILSLGTEIIEVVLLDVVSVLLFGAILVALNLQLALVSFAFVLVIGLVIYRASPHLRANDQAVFNARRSLQSHLIEMFEGIETIKFASQEDDFTDRGQTLLRRATLAEVRGARLGLRISLLVSILTAFASLSVLGFGGFQVVSGSMTAGALVAFSGLLGGILGPLNRLAQVYDSVQELRIAVGRVNDVLSMPREQVGGSAACPQIKGRLQLENVSFSYDPGSGSNVLSNIDLDVAPGQKVALVGPSGSGKSTLVKLINRLLDPTGGRVLVDDIDIAHVEPNSLRRQIGVVEQSPYIFAGTIRDNIAKAAPDLPLERLATAARLSGAAEFIERFPMGYDTRIGEGGRTLSGGQAQRLIIARALANDPAMLILDEATSALDNESEEAVQRSLDMAMKDRTVIAIAHRLSTIRNADRILVLEAGRIVESGSHESLMALRGVYHRLVMSGEGEQSPTLQAEPA